MYKPSPIDTSNIILSECLLALCEQIARNVHENWAALRISQGWKYGPKRDDILKIHPCIVPYEALDENEKEFDRRTSIETIRMIVALGYSVSLKKIDEF